MGVATWGYAAIGLVSVLTACSEPPTSFLPVDAAPVASDAVLADAVLVDAVPADAADVPVDSDPGPARFTVEVDLRGTGSGIVTSEGTLSCPGTCTVSVRASTTLSLVARANAGARFESWGGGCAQADTSTCSLTVIRDLAITATFTAVGTRIAVASSNPPFGISIFTAPAGNDAMPIARIAGPATTLSSLRGITVANNEIYVVDRSAKSITVFPVSAIGDVAPIRRIVGPDTALGDLCSVIVSGGEIYVGQLNGPILVYPQTANGNVAPTRQITGLTAGGYLAIDNGEIYATDRGSLRVVVFPATTSGAIVPTRTIAGARTGLSRPVGILVHGGELFVSENADNTVRVFAQLASGNVAPRRVLAGENTLFSVPEQMSVLGSELHVANFGTTSVLVFPVNATGDVEPTRQIVGPSSGLAGPLGLWIF